MRKYLIVIGILILTAALTTFTFHKLNQPGILFSKGHRLFENRLHKEAVPYLTKAVTLSPNFKRALKDLALASLWTGDYDQARACFARLDKLDPENRFSRRGIADILAWSGQRQQAIDIYLLLLKDHPSDFMTMRSLADALYWDKQYDEAIKFYQRYLHFDPVQQESIVRLADSMIQNGQREDGFKILSDLELRYPAYPPAIKTVANFYLTQKDYDRAAAEYEKVLSINSDDLESIARLAEILVAKNEWERAIELATKSAAAHPDDIGTQILYGNILLWTKNYKQAQQTFSSLLEKWPGDPAAMSGLVKAHIWSGDLGSKENTALLENLLKKDPENTEILNIAIDAAIGSKNFAKAEGLLKKILSIEPGNAKLREKLGDVLSWQGKFGEAEQQYKMIQRKRR